MPASSKTDNRLAYRLLREYPLEAARTLEKSPIGEVVSFLSTADIAEISEVLRLMNNDTAAACLSSWPAQRVAELVSALPPRVSSQLLRSLSAEERTAVIEACGERAGRPIRRLLRYPDGTAGALMDPNPPAQPSDVDVSTARGYMAKVKGGESHYLYITDRDDVLIGVCSVRDLSRARLASPLHQVMQKSVSMIPALANKTAIIEHPGWQAHHALPVVRNDEALLGVINYRILREIERENSAQSNEPLFLAVGGMYWSTLAHFTEDLMHLLQPENERKDGHA